MSEMGHTVELLRMRAARMGGTLQLYDRGWMLIDIPNDDGDSPSDSCGTKSLAAVAAFLDVLEKEGR